MSSRSSRAWSTRLRVVASVGAIALMTPPMVAQPSSATDDATAKPPVVPASPNRAPAPAETNPEIVISTTDGTILQGIRLTQDDISITLEIAGIPARVTRDRISRVRELEPVLQRYKTLREAAPISDVAKRVELVQWLMDRRQLDLASSEIELLRAAHPTSRAVADLTPALERRQKEIARTSSSTKPSPSRENDLAERPEASPPAVPDRDARAPTKPQPATTDVDSELENEATPAAPTLPIPEPSPTPREQVVPEASGLVVPLLTDAQIALMKVFELDLTENPRVAFPRPVVRQMLEQYAASPLVPSDRLERDALLRQPPIKHVDLMFRLQAREFYDKVQVIDTPAPMRTFRDQVHGIFIVNACSTNACHGGLEAGRLVLSNYRPNADPTVWTNFYILSRFKNSAGQSLINWDEPQASPLLQYALPRDQSRLPHPPVMRNGQDQWRPALQGPDDRRYAATIHWLSSMYRPRPEYTIEYTPARPFAPEPLRSKPIAPSVPR